MMNEERLVTATKTPSRVDNRIPIPRAERAFVEFDYPQPMGKRRRLVLLDMSNDGLCFALPFYGLTGIDLSTNILDVLVRIGRCEIGGELLVSHVTRESEERVLCGGRFYPASETDRLQMTKAIMCLESLQES
jgi:hypothetical protein